jgi:hypothetical protein
MIFALFRGAHPKGTAQTGHDDGHLHASRGFLLSRQGLTLNQMWEDSA